MPRNCGDCLNATKKNDEKPCVVCYATTEEPGKHYPQWEPKQ